MHIIKVKFLGPTNHKGSRLKCSCVGWTQKPSRVYPYPYNTGNPFESIATKYLNDMIEFNFDFDLIGASYDSNTSTAYVVFAFNPAPRHVMVTDKASVPVTV